jgi:hypothetical protein
MIPFNVLSMPQLPALPNVEKWDDAINTLEKMFPQPAGRQETDGPHAAQQLLAFLL